jgi:HK97 family phage prohead protease
MNVASFDLVEFKAMDGDQGLFAARVSAFGNVDRGGDRVIKGAFKKSIQRWIKSTKKVPVIFSHDWKVIEHYIGTVDPKSMMETDDGLVVAGQLDIHDNPKAMRVFKKLKDGSLSGWSFGYEVKQERTADDGARDLLEVELLELGPTLVGMNEEAITLGTKDALEDLASDPPVEEVKEEDVTVTETTTLSWSPEIELKVGRALSSKREARLRAIHKELTDFLAEFGADDVEQASSTPDGQARPFGEKELLQRDIDDATVFVAERTA